jgi:hypothetical protein
MGIDKPDVRCESYREDQITPMANIEQMSFIIHCPDH